MIPSNEAMFENGPREIPSVADDEVETLTATELENSETRKMKG